jgi:DNA-binding GntR family transcriptional regulator
MTWVATAAPPSVSRGVSHELVAIIRGLILNGDLRAGDRLLPRDLQSRFAVSVIPVREALRTLEAEGLVVTVPRKGTTVSELTLAELHDVYDVRRLIEPELVARATSVRTDADVRAVRDAYDQMEAAPDMDAFLVPHRAFHSRMMEPALGVVSRRILQQAWQTSERYVRFSIAAFSADQAARHDHARLMQAFADGDVAAVRMRHSQHLDLVENMIVTCCTGLLH